MEAPLASAVSWTLTIWAFSAAGIAAWWLRPSNFFGPILVLTATGGLEALSASSSPVAFTAGLAAAQLGKAFEIGTLDPRQLRIRGAWPRDLPAVVAGGVG